MGYNHRCVIKEVKKKMFLTWKKTQASRTAVVQRGWFWIIDQMWSRVSFSVGRTKILRSKSVNETLCTLTFLVQNLSRNLPRVYRKISKNIRDAVGLGWGKEKRLETLWGKKKRTKVKGRGIHSHRKSNRRPMPALSGYFAYRSVSHNPRISPWVTGNPFQQKCVGI